MPEITATHSISDENNEWNKKALAESRRRDDANRRWRVKFFVKLARLLSNTSRRLLTYIKR